MARPPLPRPSVLRCARCGRSVDWEEAQLQVVCGCRGRIDLPPVMVREATAADREAVSTLFDRDFGRNPIVAAEALDLHEAPAIVAEMKGEIAGALAYRVLDDALQILALATDPIWQRAGVGGNLIAEAELLARRSQLRRVRFWTTNDNLPSLYFYQRRGYHLAGLVPGALAVRPKCPAAAGFAGIPVRDEIRLEKTL
jgi:N-acetylglutamate synthase-like GNAT family acetyltransferase